MISNKLRNTSFNKGRKLNNSIAFYYTLMFCLNSTHVLIMKIPNKRELHQAVINYSSDIDFQDFMKIYRKCTARPCFFLVLSTRILYVLDKIF